MWPAMSIRELLERHGVRCTRQREAVYAALAGSPRHPTAEELFHEIRQRLPGLSLATVYNALEALCARGLARRLPALDGSGAIRYDAEVHPHVHLVGEDGRVVDAPRDVSERVLGQMDCERLADLERQMGMRVQGVWVSLRRRDDEPSVPGPDHADPDRAGESA